MAALEETWQNEANRSIKRAQEIRSEKHCYSNETRETKTSNLDESISDPILHLDEQEWNLSNLCQDNNSIAAKAKQPTLSISQVRSSPARSRRRHNQEKLYPAKDEVLSNSLNLKSVEELFNPQPKPLRSPEFEPPTTSRGNDRQTKILQQEQRSRVGAFADPSPATNSPFTTNSKKTRPPPPTWVCGQKSGKKNDDKVDDSSKHDCEYRTIVDLPTELPTSPSPSSSSVSSSNDEYSFSSDDEGTNTSRPEVEVAPGKYLPLRGAVETMEAVNNGSATVVTCFACQVMLRCVPDADMVICPDCRVISPVCTSEDDKTQHHDHECLSGEDDDYYDKRRTTSSRRKVPRQHSLHQRHSIGGVGLGLRIDL